MNSKTQLLVIDAVNYRKSNGCKFNTIAILIIGTNCLRYNAETQKATNVWTRVSRNERFERYWRLMTERRLRRQRLVFLSFTKNRNVVQRHQIRCALTEYYNQLLGQFRSEFEHTHEMLTEIFAGQGARIIPMKDADHFRHYQNIFESVTGRAVRLRPD